MSDFSCLADTKGRPEEEREGRSPQIQLVGRDSADREDPVLEMASLRG